ncbi:hypothetical protein ACFQL7_20570 [Halocatena marina]|uniref:Uncharacterized protein n=1 Tax=Halocatena marina TaxID=2934937 RepID=A0ABD5YSQ4_9EURY|nr:hypothetical protein [Halocatena marina]
MKEPAPAMKQAKLVDDTDVAPARPDGACLRFDQCGNLAPGGTETNNSLCEDCLDDIRNS